MPKTILLINPWIYDFAAFDFWTKPLGLLQIGDGFFKIEIFLGKIELLMWPLRAYH
jgi:hypothetical protein